MKGIRPRSRTRPGPRAARWKKWVRGLGVPTVPAGGAEEARDERAAGAEDPDRLEAARREELLARERPDGQPCVQGDREVRGRLAPAVVGGHVLHRGGGADEDRGFADPGDEAERPEPEARRQAVGEHGRAGDRRPADHQDPPAVHVAEPAHPGAEERGRDGEGTDRDADREAAAVELVLDVAGTIGRSAPRHVK